MMDNQSKKSNDNLFDIVMNDKVEFVTIQDQVLETAMSSMTDSFGR